MQLTDWHEVRTPRPTWRGAIILAILSAGGAGAACVGAPELETPAVRPTYSASGRLDRLEYDSNRNGKPDAWAYMEGPRVGRIEIDRDEDGVIDRWEYYRPDGTIDKIGLSRTNSGRPDTWAYQAVDGTLDRLETTTRPDQRTTRTEYYRHGKKVRVEDDGNRDGRIDRWETWSDGALVEVALDIDSDGRPDKRIEYPGGIAAVAKVAGVR